VDDARTHDMRTQGEPVRDVAVGDDIGGYVVDGELGVGGMGVVYSAVHPVIGKRAAVKVLRAELSDDPDSVSRFIREAQLVNKIRHPNIVDIFAIGRLTSGQYYLVMDLLEGETLRDRLRRGPLSLAETASVLDEMAAALVAAHDQGIIHRDLKPDNVFLVAAAGRWPAVKLLDFGVAKLMRATNTPVSQATQTGIALGTPWYMSPEQARAKNVDHRTDIYALGVMAYEMLTGVRPFNVIADGGSLADAAADSPRDLVDVIEAMIADEADARPTLPMVRAAIKRARRTLRADEVVGPASSLSAMDAARTIVERWPAEGAPEPATTQMPGPTHATISVDLDVPADDDDVVVAGPRDEDQTRRRSPAPFLEQPTTIGVPPPPVQARVVAVAEPRPRRTTPVAPPQPVIARVAVAVPETVVEPPTPTPEPADVPTEPSERATHTEIVRIRPSSRMPLLLVVVAMVALVALALAYLQ
jgi:serine/threonine-protein kinase